MLPTTSSLAGAAASGPVCIHCRRHKRTRPRGLCRSCHEDRGIRRQYPPISPHGRRMPSFMDTVGPRPAPRTGTVAPPGSAAKILELQERVARGLSPFSPLDRPMDPEVDRWPAQAPATPATPPPVAPVPSAPARRPPRRRPTRRPAAPAAPAAGQQPFLPFVPPLEDQAAARAPARRSTATSTWGRRPGVVLVRARAGGAYVLATARRPRRDPGRLAVIATDDVAWLAARLEVRWAERRVAGGPGFRLDRRERAWVRQLASWPRGQKPLVQGVLWNEPGRRGP